MKSNRFTYVCENKHQRVVVGERLPNATKCTMKGCTSTLKLQGNSGSPVGPGPMTNMRQF